MTRTDNSPTAAAADDDDGDDVDEPWIDPITFDHHDRRSRDQRRVSGYSIT